MYGEWRDLPYLQYLPIENACCFAQIFNNKCGLSEIRCQLLRTHLLNFGNCSFYLGPPPTNYLQLYRIEYDRKDKKLDLPKNIKNAYLMV